jgi:predicted O-methyltransferase YrrM
MRVRDFSVVAALVVALATGASCAGKGTPPTSTPQPGPTSAPTAAPAPAPAPAAPPAAQPVAPAKPLRDPDVIYVPTPQNVVEAMLKLASVTSSDVVYDLGSGDGRIAITAAQKYGARAVGIDINPERIKEANANLAKANVGDKVRFLNQDLFETDLSPATVITLYLLPSLNQKLIPKLKQLKPGTRIVSHSFDMGPDWAPEKTEDVQGRMIYYWTIK